MKFDGFAPPQTVAVGAARFRIATAGSGPVVVLLHGHPQTLAAWHGVAPLLAERFRVLCVDLPGYGGSSIEREALPLAATRDALARQLLALVDALEIDRFSIAGHDLGGRVGHRMAQIAKQRVSALAVLGIVPVPEISVRADMAFALSAYRSFWFAQSHPKPEALLQQAPQEWFEGSLPGQAERGFFAPEAVADYLAAIEGPEALAAMSETLRRSMMLDAAFERGLTTEERRIACPLLVLWGTRSTLGGWYEPDAAWREHAGGPMRVEKVDAGHFLPEERPDEVACVLGDFFSSRT